MLPRQIINRIPLIGVRHLAVRTLSTIPPIQTPDNSPPTNIPTTPSKSLPIKIPTPPVASPPAKTLSQKITEHPFVIKLGHVLELGVEMGHFFSIGMFMIIVLLNYPLLFPIAVILLLVLL